MSPFRRPVWLLAIGTLASPVLALSPIKPGDSAELQFRPTEVRLSDAAKVDLARKLPKLYLLNVETLIIDGIYGADRKHGLPTKQQALTRVETVARFYESAGVPKARIFTGVRLGDRLPMRPDVVRVAWSGWCKPARYDECQAEYFKQPPAAASQPAQSPPATSP